jgi:hypothetical protein
LQFGQTENYFNLKKRLRKPGDFVFFAQVSVQNSNALLHQMDDKVIA